MKSAILNKLRDAKPIDADEALHLTSLNGPDLLDLFTVTNRLREKHAGRKIKLCSIINAKSGKCEEDCSFCAQSSHYSTKVDSYPLVGKDKIVETARAARETGAREFSIVTSGFGVSGDADVNGVVEGIKAVRDEVGMLCCVSPGIVDKNTLSRFKESGLNFYHHNLETARSYFKNVCTTHDYEEDVEAVRTAVSLGLKVCSGGIFGIGESWEHRVEMFLTLRELNVHSIPINFLNPIPGTPMATKKDLTPMDCLKIVALARSILPNKDITVCGGREVNLRDLQVMMFFAGANGTMAGNYLTTKGRPAEEDLRMIADAGLEVEN